MITTNILQRVFRILHNGKTASAYTIEKGGNQYLVSAAHVFDGDDEISEISINHNGEWKTLLVTTVFNSLDVGDTIVFKLESDISPRHDVQLGSGHIILGTWAYFLGFPFGMGSDGGSLNNNYPIPFIKAALISNIDTERYGLSTIYLDGHNNKGFSGGPAVWVNPQNFREIKIIGTVSSYLTESPINTDTMDDIKSYGTNAGIVECFCINDLLSRI